MLSLAKDGYTQEQVKAQLNMSKGNRKVAFSYALMDKNDIFMGWLPQIDGSIAHDSTAEIKNTAKFKLTQKLINEIDLSNDRIQPYYKLKMLDEWIEWPLGIFLLASPTRSDKAVGLVTSEIEAYDKGQILIEDKFSARYTVSAGATYTAVATSIINSSGITNVNIIASSLMLPTAIEFEIGYPKLTAVNDLLMAINYNSLSFDEQGFAISSPYVEPVNRVVEYDYQTNQTSTIKSGANEKLDLFNIPNVFVRYTSNPDSDSLRSVYTNNNPTDKLSTVVRGRSVVDTQSISDIADQTTLDAFTRRAAIKAMQVYGSFNFTTVVMPHHTNLDCLRVKHSRLGTDELYVEQAWSMDLKSGADMSHICKKVVEL